MVVLLYSSKNCLFGADDDWNTSTNKKNINKNNASKKKI